MKKFILFAGLAGLILVTGACSSKNVVAKQDQDILALKTDIEGLKARQDQLENAIVSAHKSARSSDEARVEGKTEVTAPGPSSHDGPAVAPSKGGWHLRVVSLPASEAGKKEAESIVKFLGEHGVEDAVARLSHGKTSHWVVDAGAFSSAEDKSAASMKQKVRSLKFRGTQFKDARLVEY